MQPRPRGITTGLALLAVAGTSAVAVAGPAAASSGSGVARVYVSLPREGKGAASAAQIAKGLRAALKDRKSAAGGRKIRFVWMNDAKGPRWNAARVRANARRAAADPQAVAYVGEGNSEATAVSMSIINRAGLVHLSPVSTASALTDPATAGRYQPTGVQTFFRPIPGDARQSSALLSAVRRAGARKRVVVVDDGTLYGHGLIKGFRAGSAKARVRVVAGHVADRDGKRLKRLAARVAANRPTAIVYGGSPSSNAAQVLRALHRAAPKAVLLGGDALAHDSFVKRLGVAQTRLRITTPAAHVDPRKKTGRSLGARPDPFAVFAYNGMQAVLRAIDRAGRTGAVTRASVRDAVFDGSIQRGLSGAWKITGHGDSVYGVYDILQAASGRIVTPVDRLTGKLVREERAKQRRQGTAKRRASSRTLGASARAGMGVAGPPALTIGAMDLETTLRMVQQERTRLLDEQLRTQIEAVQKRNAQIAKLNEVMVALHAVKAHIADTQPSARLDGSGPPAGYAADVARLRTVAQAAGVELELGSDARSWTRGTLDAAITRVKGMIDGLSNDQQMDMLRLQALTNRRNEALDALSNAVRKMRESNASIIRNF